MAPTPEVLAEVDRLRRERHDINNRLATLWARAELEGVAMPPEDAQADVQELKVSRDGISLRSASLNTLASVVAAGAAILAVVLLYQHQGEARESGAAFVGAIKEQTTAIRDQTAVGREQNCLMKFDQRERQQNADFCRDVSGVTRAPR